MGLAEITGRQPVLEAIAEFDRLHRDPFLKKYGFGRSPAYWLIHGGKRYDSKAIIGAAHGYARPDLGPLKAAGFTGGEARVQRKLEELGFTVEIDAVGITDGVLTSKRLTPGTVYTVEQFADMRDAKRAALDEGNWASGRHGRRPTRGADQPFTISSCDVRLVRTSAPLSPNITVLEMK